MSLGDDTGRTRTRLPEAGGDPYGGARRNGRSSSRSLVTVVGVVVLLIAAIAFANRGGGDSDAEEGGDSPKAAATAPTGEKPVASGFAHDRQGAESAAANYSVVLGSDGMFKEGSRHSILEAIYTPDAAEKLRPAMDQAYSVNFLSKLGLDASGNPPQGSTFVSRTIPVGTKVEQYDDNSARVAVWYMGLIGMSGEKSTDPVTTTWKTWTFELQWVDGDWKISADAQKDGPAPVPGDDRAASSEEISKAVEEYGGFTYAR
ncbi:MULTISPECIES: hypothetical protein [Actinomycetes]|uniref:hypothetical protein n=1 Tax=Actinomycetes TaxID=1760 RepID=UPI00193FEB31|nr:MULTISPECIES: hypothetical protein [Actinomycetes]MBM4830001.1 hypothetical protein [Actinospica acidiphila]